MVSRPPAALMTFGADGVLFSLDRPFGDNRAAIDNPSHRGDEVCHQFGFSS